MICQGTNETDGGPGPEAREERVLVAAATGCDVDVLCRIVEEAGLEGFRCLGMMALCAEIEAGAAAAILTEEMLFEAERDDLTAILDRQPEWSDFPLIVLGMAGNAGEYPGWSLLKEMNGSAHTIFLQRPVRSRTLTSAVRAAIRARTRQYQVRDELRQRREVEDKLRMVRHDLERRVEERTAELQRRADQLSRLSSQLTLTEQRERRQLAQVLHDHLQQLLVGAKMRLDQLVAEIAGPDGELARQAGETLSEAIAISRSLTVEVSPPILYEAGLPAAVEWLGRWMEEQQGLHVELDLDEEADPEREDVRVLVFQSVRELLFNVVKHAGVKEARVRLGTCDGMRLELTVEDDGKGFDLLKVMEGSAEETDATGFGLLNVRERLLLLGGELRVETEPGKGARFTLLAPRHGEVSERARPADRECARPGREQLAMGGPARRSRDGPIRILLVDDHSIVREGFRMLLESKPDMEVVGEASDGAEGVAMARELRPDVVLMDFSMPGMNGVEATRRIREEAPEARVIGLSMYEESERAAAMINAGASAYLDKTGKQSILLEQIRALNPAGPEAAPSPD